MEIPPDEDYDPEICSESSEESVNLREKEFEMKDSFEDPMEYLWCLVGQMLLDHHDINGKRFGRIEQTLNINSIENGIICYREFKQTFYQVYQDDKLKMKMKEEKNKNSFYPNSTNEPKPYCTVRTNFFFADVSHMNMIKQTISQFLEFRSA